MSKETLANIDFRKGSWHRNNNFKIFSQNEGSGICVVIPKKIIRLSVKRHLLKRRIHSALRNINSQKTLIIYPNKSAQNLSFDAMVSELKHLISSI